MKKKTSQNAAWFAVSGKIESKNGVLRHTPNAAETQEALSFAPSSVARSNIKFKEGTINFDVTLQDREGSCALVLNQGLQFPVLIGLNLAGHPFSICSFRDNRMEPLVSAGGNLEFSSSRTYHLSVTVEGSKILLSVDGVHLCQANHQVIDNQVAFFMQSTKTVSISNIDTKSATPSAFVVMQFKEEYNDFYKEVIKPTCEKHGLDVIRADDMYTSGLIIQDIIQSLEESSIVIAEVTPDNPNVYYELGYAHGINKPTILLCDRSREKLPFDISGIRTIFYENKIAGKSQVEERLSKHLEYLGFQQVGRHNFGQRSALTSA